LLVSILHACWLLGDPTVPAVRTVAGTLHECWLQGGQLFINIGFFSKIIAYAFWHETQLLQQGMMNRCTRGSLLEFS
jgi:hypothetical protein